MKALLVILLLTVLFRTLSFAAADLDDARREYEDGNYAGAFAIYRGLAEQGDPEAAYMTGFLYAEGKGVKADLAECAAWMRVSANQGYDFAQVYMGDLYFDGKGVPQSYAEAVKWYLRAASRGNVDAQYDLGVMYEMGYGVSKDCDFAEDWYERAATQGDEEAMEALQSHRCRDLSNVASLRYPFLRARLLL